MEELLARIGENLVDRVSGPMKFRLLLQPLMAIFFALRDGIHDARSGRPVYFWTLFREPAQRRELLREGWKSVGRVFILAVIMDMVYQIIVFRWFYPGESLLVAIFLAFLPYLALRGPINRLARGIFDEH